MLRGIDPILSPDLLRILRAMGHGDELVIADANFPAEACARQMVRLDGISAVDTTKAILSLMPLDCYVETAAFSMEDAANPDQLPPIVREFQAVIDKVADNASKIKQLERFEFYDHAKTCFAIIQTGEMRHFGNLILKKGVIKSA